MTSSPAGNRPSFPVLRGDEAFFIVQNTGSGRKDAADIQAGIRSVLEGAGRRFEIMAVDDPSQLAATARRAVQAARDAGGVVVACGGDGTLNAVAQEVLGSGLPFGILPQGTFNYFGRRHGISQDTEAAARCLVDARLAPVQVGLLNGRAFLVNASLGLYPQLLEDREAYKQRYGRSRYVALWAGLSTLRRAHRQLTLQLEQEGQTRILRTPTLVVGNNALQLEHVGIAEGAELERGRLVAMGVRPVGTWALYGLLLRGLISRLGDAENVFSFGFDELVVRPSRSRGRIKVAMDGEISHIETPLVFSVSPHRLPLLVPREDGGTVAA
jgi:diacylglycerol kinase family enzyme